MCYNDIVLFYKGGILMKKVMAIIMAICVILGSASIVGAEGNIALRVDGSAVKCDVAPTIINNRTMVPFRAIPLALHELEM